MLTESEHLPLLVLYCLAGAILLQKVFTVVHRLFFHPLANVPGPVLAHATFLYSFWYNLNGARFYLQIEKLHRQYGMLPPPPSHDMTARFPETHGDTLKVLSFASPPTRSI